MAKHAITRADILSMEAYGQERQARRAALVQKKKLRRVEVGPIATFYFESYETMWHQVHEMLFIEKGGETQIEDELSAFNPLIPQGDELVATVMFEIADEARRRAFLARLGGVEHRMFLEVAGQRVDGRSESDVDRTTAAGKASSVQFVRFPLGTAVAAFKRAGTRVIVGIDHPAYSHMAVLSEEARAALAEDLD